MSSPRTPDEVRASWQEVGDDIERRRAVVDRHRFGREELAPQQLAEHTIALLAEARHLAQLADAYRSEWALLVVQAGVPMVDIAAAAGMDVTALRAELLRYVSLMELVHQRPGSRFGMDPVRADEVRALIDGADQ